MKNSKKEDLRVIKTKKLIKKSFVELSKNISYQKISIKDLCDKAMINRNTFYLHYTNKDDLVKEIVSETIDKYKINFMPLIAKFFVNIRSKDVDGFTQNIKEILAIINEDIDFYKIVLSDDYLTGYFSSIVHAYEKIIMDFLNVRTVKAKLIFRYMMSGCSGILTDWILKDTLPTDETAKIIAKLALENIYYFTEENRVVQLENA